MATTKDKILKLTRELYPTGKAFRIREGTNIYALHDGLAESESDIFDNAKAIQNQVLPDNPFYTEDDAAAWEEKLQIPIAPTGVSLEDRKLAILRKLRYPGNVLARQSADFIEGELVTAGFNVKVYENKFAGEVDFIKVGGGATIYTEFSNETEFGLQTVFQAVPVDETATGVVISQLDQADEDIIDQNEISFRSTFIICADPYPALADVPSAREREFRNLIMTLKPAHTHAFLFINYV